MRKSFVLIEIVGFALLLLGAWHWFAVKSDVALILFQLVGLGLIAYGCFFEFSTAGGWSQ